MQETLKAIHKDRNSATLFWVLASFGFIWMFVIMLQSPGFFFLDEVAHVNLARDAWFDPKLIWDWWGRIGYTLPYMLPSLFGLTGTRVFSILLTVAIFFLLTDIARMLGIKRLYLIPLTFLFQPWVIILHYGANTMIPFSFFMILGINFWLKDKLNLASLAFGIMTLCRHEGIALLGLWFLYLAYHRHFVPALMCTVPTILYNLTYMPVMGVGLLETPFIVNYLTPKPTEFYGTGTWLWFVNFTVWAMGIVLFFWWLHGVFVTRWRSKEGLIILFYLSFLVLHTVIYRFGLFASGGYGFFVLPIAPGLAITATRGIEFAMNKLEKGLSGKSAVFVGIVTVIVFIPILINTLFFVGTRGLDIESQRVLEAAIWLEENNADKSHVLSTHPYFDYSYSYGINITPPMPSEESTLDYPEGTIIVWDSHFSDRLGFEREYLENPENGWQQLAEFGEEAIIFRRGTQTD